MVRRLQHSILIQYRIISFFDKFVSNSISFPDMVTIHNTNSFPLYLCMTRRDKILERRERLSQPKTSQASLLIILCSSKTVSSFFHPILRTGWEWATFFHWMAELMNRNDASVEYIPINYVMRAITIFAVILCIRSTTASSSSHHLYYYLGEPEKEKGAYASKIKMKSMKSALWRMANTDNKKRIR